jgi:hypothetical protein
MATAETLAWPTITLAWRQRVAASWLISWPSWLGSFVFVSAVSYGWSVADLSAHRSVLSALANLAFLVFEGLLVRRMIRKRYRSFRLTVVREDGSTSNTLSPGEIMRVWLRIIWAQVGFLVAVWVLLYFQGTNASADVTRTMSTLSLWGRILVVGPFGIYCAVPAEYPSFRLEAFGQRFV